MKQNDEYNDYDMKKLDKIHVDDRKDEE